MDKIKAAFIAVFTALSAWLGVLAVPIFLLVAVNIIDYGTGLAAAKYRNQKISSYKGFRGIAKKVCMWLLVVVGAVVDSLIAYGAGQAGYRLHFGFAVASLVAVWLICNEIISILENISDIGVQYPRFLERIVENMKSQAEGKAYQTLPPETVKDKNSGENTIQRSGASVSADTIVKPDSH